MKTVRRLLYRQIITSVAYVTIAFLALFFFIDFIDALRDMGHKGYTLADAIWTCLLSEPGHLYDVFPISLLIGTTLALSQLAQSSQLTILRTSGLSPQRALMVLGGLGIGAAVLLVAVGDWLMPVAEQHASQHKAAFRNSKTLKLGQSGAWLREKRAQPSGNEHTLTVNVNAAKGQSHLLGIRIFEFDEGGRLIRRIGADEARVSQAGAGSIWLLKGVTDTHWPAPVENPEQAIADNTTHVREVHLPELAWESRLTPTVVAASVLPPSTMSTMDLWRYTQHLADNAQAAQRYEIQFWKRAAAPLGCLVMVALALPFAYLNSRKGGAGLKIFGGIMLGISFMLVNHISGHLGLLQQWKPWIAATMPSIIYLLLSMATFAWLVRNR